jgi:hypothetical protein
MKLLRDLSFMPVVLLLVLLFMFFKFLDDVCNLTAETIKRRSLRYGLWMINLRKSCPYCGDKIITHGFEPDERYTCENIECRFNEVEG